MYTAYDDGSRVDWTPPVRRYTKWGARAAGKEWMNRQPAYAYEWPGYEVRKIK
jgi:hypothetical protein